ncbi:hypothetical protein EL17_20110 [Anditalea andensis]|uniref:Uncharacterized protein n=1 Tax=Anditalea andensis TaxID=1048983 RepID=A0A074KVF3_9BACT|nr:hypothetical protein EL17_20110 [Anditalea andensis]
MLYFYRNRIVSGLHITYSRYCRGPEGTWYDAGMVVKCYAAPVFGLTMKQYTALNDQPQKINKRTPEKTPTLL